MFDQNGSYEALERSIQIEGMTLYFRKTYFEGEVMFFTLVFIDLHALVYFIILDIFDQFVYNF